MPKQRRHLDLVTLATDGMQKARANAARRLMTKAESTSAETKPLRKQETPETQKDDDKQQQKDQQQQQTDEQQPLQTNDMTEADAAVTSSTIAADIKNARKTSRAVAMLPSYDADMHNPDGTLRTVHNMPTFESAWEEAQKARYIRSKHTLERERELSINEIFDKKN